jgi:ankyrin repeat domain-containing protein 50
MRRNSQNPEENIGLAFLYLNYQFMQSLGPLLGSLIRQLTESLKKLPEAVKGQWESHSKGEFALDDRNFLNLLHEVSANRRVFIIVDALDECDPATRKPLLDTLKSLGGRVSLFVTSRYLADFEELFDDFERVNLTVHSEDIRDYVDHCVDQSKRLKAFAREDRTLRHDLKHTIVAKSGDM